MKTKNNEEIKISIYEDKSNELRSKLFSTFIFNASVNSETVGYSLLTFIPESKSHLIKTPMDFLIYKTYGTDDNTIKAYEEKNIIYLLDKLANKFINKNQISNLEHKQIDSIYNQFVSSINEDYKKQHQKFIDYWVQKPAIELIRVFTDKDILVSDYSTGVVEKIKREPVNWQKKGIGLALYESIVDWCGKNQLELWASNTRTEDAKNMWKIMEKHPKFFVSMVECLKSPGLNKETNIDRLKVKFS